MVCGEGALVFLVLSGYGGETCRSESSSVVFFFFFQAEDGIRDLTVTGVQTCALPIWRYGRPIALPVPPAAVVQFIVDHMGRSGDLGLRWDLPADLDSALVHAGLKKKPGPLAFSSLVHRVAVLSAAHKQARQDNPCEDRAVRTLLSKGRRASHKRGERPAKKTALSAADLRAMAATCDTSLKGKRDRALLYFAFASGGRPPRARPAGR